MISGSTTDEDRPMGRIMTSDQSVSNSFGLEEYKAANAAYAILEEYKSGQNEQVEEAASGKIG